MHEDHVSAFRPTVPIEGLHPRRPWSDIEPASRCARRSPRRGWISGNSRTARSTCTSMPSRSAFRIGRPSPEKDAPRVVVACRRGFTGRRERWQRRRTSGRRSGRSRRERARQPHRILSAGWEVRSLRSSLILTDCPVRGMACVPRTVQSQPRSCDTASAKRHPPQVSKVIPRGDASHPSWTTTVCERRRRSMRVHHGPGRSGAKDVPRSEPVEGLPVVLGHPISRGVP
jgi:hypothetical protein